MRPKAWTFPVFLLAAILITAKIARADVFTMRISTENRQSHFHTVVVGRFAAEVSTQSNGRIQATHAAEARMFRDRDVVKALQGGHLEMAVPGTWQLDRFVPDVGLLQLPLAYGREREAIHALTDGPIGRSLNAGIERRLQLKVLGRWIDLGHAHIFAIGAPIESYEDLVDRRIRVAGGQANIQRIEGLGARAFIVPWPDLPAAMAAKSIDGVLTSYATVASARLWEKGVSSAFEDSQYFAQYVPLVSDRFWRKLPADLRTLLVSVWEKQVDHGRRLAEDAQQAAKKAFVENGGLVVVPPADERERRRADLIVAQNDLVAALGMSPELVISAMEMKNLD